MQPVQTLIEQSDQDLNCFAILKDILWNKNLKSKI